MTALAAPKGKEEKALVALPESPAPGTVAPKAESQKPPAQIATGPKAPPKRSAPSRPPALVGTWKDQGEICKHTGKRVNCWTAYMAYKDWAEARRQSPVDFSTFCIEVALHTTEIPAKTSSFFLDAEIPVKLKVVGNT